MGRMGESPMLQGEGLFVTRATRLPRACRMARGER